MDATDEGIDQRVGHPRPELARDERADGAVTEPTPHVGPRQEGVAEEPELAPRAEDPRARRRPEAGRHAEREPLGQCAQLAPGEDGRAPPGNRHEQVAEPHLAGELDRLGAATEEAVGSQVHHAPAELVAAQGAPQAVRGFQDDDGRGIVAWLGAAGELPRRAEATDASADHHHPPAGHVSRPGPPRSRRRPGHRRRWDRR